MNSDIHELFLQLVRVGIEHTGKSVSKFFDERSDIVERQNSGLKSVDWVRLKALADAQGLSAIVLDGLNEVRSRRFNVGGEFFPSQQFTLQWIGEVLQNYEQRYSAYKKAISGLAGFYNRHGYKMMVIKGYGLSFNYPKPPHRPCGDIDIWLFNQQEAADKELGSWFKVQGSRALIDESHHHHTVFEWEGFTVENHYDFMNVHYGHRSKELEVIFKELSKDDSLFVEVNGEKVYLPSPNLHALFLLRHSLQDFAAAVLTLRQVLDWAFFIEKHTEDIDWEWLKGIIKEYNMTDFYNCLNAICVGDLGFNVKIFPSVQFDTYLKEKVLNDIIYPAFMRSDEGRGLLGRILFKYRRWQGNAWKQELCYHDSRWEAFWNGVWNHLLKPKTI